MGQEPADAELRLQCGERQLRHLLRGLVAIVLLWVGLYGLNLAIGKPSWHLNVLLDLDGEHSLPAWFSALQLAGVGALLLIAATQPSARRPALSLFLGLLGLGMLFLSADEAVGLHERVSQLNRRLDLLPSFRGGRGVWIFAYGLLGLVLLAFCLSPLRDWYRRRPQAVRTVWLGFALMLFGGVVLEALGYEFIRNRGLQGLYVAQMVIEELLEMLGGSLMLVGALRLLVEEQAAMPGQGEEK